MGSKTSFLRIITLCDISYSFPETSSDFYIVPKVMFEMSFMLFDIKLSASKGIRYSLRRDNPIVHKIFVLNQRECERLAKAEAALGFLYNCKSNGVYRSFVHWTNAKRLKHGKNTRLMVKLTFSS